MCLTQVNPEYIIKIPKDKAPGNVNINDRVMLSNGLPAKVTAKDDKQVTLDLNHQLAGKHLTFDVTLVDLTTADSLQKVTFGAGCFWGPELAFQRVPGEDQAMFLLISQLHCCLCLCCWRFELFLPSVHGSDCATNQPPLVLATNKQASEQVVGTNCMALALSHRRTAKNPSNFTCRWLCSMISFSLLKVSHPHGGGVSSIMPPLTGYDLGWMSDCSCNVYNSLHCIELANAQ